MSSRIDDDTAGTKGKKERPDGAGQIKELPDGRYRAMLPRDKQGRRPKKICANEKEACAWIKDQLAKREQGVDVTAARQTVKAFAAVWLDQHISRTRRKSTTTSYRQVLDRYVLPTLGRRRLDQLTHAEVQQLVNDLSDQGRAPDTVRNAHRRLSALLDAAVKYGYVVRNVAKGVDLPPAADGGSVRCLSTTEAAALLRAAQEGKYHNALLYSVLLLLGLRRGEAVGLLWRDVDREAGTITVTQTISEVDGRLIIGPPKTHSSRRTLPLSACLIDGLGELWEQQQYARRVLGPDWKEHGLIFASEVGTPVRPTNLNVQFARIKKRAKLDGSRLRLHDLRHTFATMLGDLEVETRVIGALLGHGPKTATDRYRKVTITQKRAALELLSEELRRAA